MNNIALNWQRDNDEGEGMSKKSLNHPPYILTPGILNRVAAISVVIERLTAHIDLPRMLQLWRTNRIHAINGSLAINSLSEAMILDTVTTSIPQVALQASNLLEVNQGQRSREVLQSVLSLLDRKSFRERYLKPALTDGLIKMTLPDKPNSRLLEYRLTDKGRQWLMQHGNG